MRAVSDYEIALAEKETVRLWELLRQHNQIMVLFFVLFHFFYYYLSGFLFIAWVTVGGMWFAGVKLFFSHCLLRILSMKHVILL